MNVGLLARVVPDGAPAFDARIANLTPGSVFVVGGSGLAFRQAVTLHLGTVALHGEVVLVARRPRGALVSFRPSEDAIRQIEDIMDDVQVLEVRVAKTSLEDLSLLTDEELDAPHDEDPEGPTNTEGEPVDIDATDSAMAANLREVQVPGIPPSSTERLTEDLVRPRTRTEPDAGVRTARAPTVIDAQLESSTADHDAQGSASHASAKAPKA